MNYISNVADVKITNKKNIFKMLRFEQFFSFLKDVPVNITVFIDNCESECEFFYSYHENVSNKGSLSLKLYSVRKNNDFVGIVINRIFWDRVSDCVKELNHTDNVDEPEIGMEYYFIGKSELQDLMIEVERIYDFVSSKDFTFKQLPDHPENAEYIERGICFYRNHMQCQFIWGSPNVNESLTEQTQSICSLISEMIKNCKKENAILECDYLLSIDSIKNQLL